MEDTYTHIALAFDEELKTLYSSSKKGKMLFPAGLCVEDAIFADTENFIRL